METEAEGGGSVKEYRVVCDVAHLNNDGSVSSFHEATSPYSETGPCRSHVFRTKAQADKFKKDVIETGRKYCEKEARMRERYPNLYSTTKITNYRIQTRNVTAWE